MIVITEPRKTPIYESHVALGAKMVLFHGWFMPIQYKGIIHEHLAVRNSAGIFDVSHMGTIEIKGTDAYNFIQNLIPNNLDKIKFGKALYSALCNDSGCMIDDLIVYMVSKQYFILIVNATNVDGDFNWMCAHKGNFNVDIKNISDKTSLVALQGPKACGIMEKFLGQSLAGLKHFYFKEFNVSGHKMIVARTGYTGEDGFEIFIERNAGKWLWDSLVKFGAEPIGLGARDTLRLEKGYILYGNDADINTTPIEAGISWTVDLNKKSFIGKEALLKKKPAKRLVWMEMTENGIPRQGCAVFCGNKILHSKSAEDFITSGSGCAPCRYKKIGVVTSGTYSPSLEKGIAMGYLTKECKDVTIEIRGKLCAAIIKKPN